MHQLESELVQVGSETRFTEVHLAVRILLVLCDEKCLHFDELWIIQMACCPTLFASEIVHVLSLIIIAEEKLSASQMFNSGVFGFQL